MKRLLILLVIALAAVSLVPRVCVAAEKFEGRVHDDSTNAGIAALTVRLGRQKARKKPKSWRPRTRKASSDSKTCKATGTFSKYIKAPGFSTARR